MSKDREFLTESISSLKQQRDELRLHLHLAGLEVKEEWDALDSKWRSLNDHFEPLKSAVGETSKDLLASMLLVAGELKSGYQRIGKALLGR